VEPFGSRRTRSCRLGGSHEVRKNGHCQIRTSGLVCATASVRTDTVERADRIVLGDPLAGGRVVLVGARPIGADCRIAVAIRASRRLELDHSCGSSCAQQRSSLTRTAAVSVACLLAARTASTRGLARAPTPANWPSRRLPRSWPRVTSLPWPLRPHGS